jgi:hypothetical protein
MPIGVLLVGMVTISTITCPKCRHQSEEQMPPMLASISMTVRAAASGFGQSAAVASCMAVRIALDCRIGAVDATHRRPFEIEMAAIIDCGMQLCGPIAR